MKSVVPIVGMLVIMLFISLAFMHAFWAMDRAGINEISMFNIVVLLFTGEQFLSPEDLIAILGFEACFQFLFEDGQLQEDGDDRVVHRRSVLLSECYSTVSKVECSFS